MKKANRNNPLRKKAKKGFRGYPVATIAYYGPDNKKATKVAVGIVHGPDEVGNPLECWYSEETDIRQRKDIHEEILAFIKENKALSVVMADGIIGCPHEEGVDYPEGQECPQCAFWKGRDRWTGLPVN